MNTRIKVCIPLCIISVTLISAALAGTLKGSPNKNTEVFAQIVTGEAVLSKLKHKILTIIDSNMSDTTKAEKEIILEEIQNYMLQFDKGKNHDFKLFLDYNMMDLQEIMEIEQKECFRDMSLDARIPAMKLLSKLCEQYGIQITYDLKGDIVRIGDLSGADIYEVEMMQDKQKIRLEILALTLLVILCFITICIYITKKKQLLIKDGIYDGYKKEGFA